MNPIESIPGKRDEPRRVLDADEAAFDLGALVAELREAASYRRGGQAARSLYRFPGLSGVLIALPGGCRIAEHQADARVSIQCLEGRVRVSVGEGEVAELAAGQLLVLDRAVRHAVEALLDSALLLTVAAGEH